MTEGIANLEALIERLEQATAEAREATSEAHSATKALRAVERDIATLLDTTAGELVNTKLGELVSESIEKIRDAVLAWSDAAHQRVDDSFRRHMNLCLHGNEQGKGPSLTVEVRDQLLLGNELLARMNAQLVASNPSPLPTARRSPKGRR